MTRQLEREQEIAISRRHAAVIRALEFEIVGTLQSQGIELLGFSARWDAYDCLLTLRAAIDGKPSVAFVGAETLITCLLRIVTDGRNDRLKWRLDKYKQNSP